MKTLALLSLCLAVALGMPAPAPGVAQNPALTEEDQHPLVGDVLPAQGHVVVDDPQPQVKLGSEEQHEKLDMGQSQSMVEPEVKVKPEVGGQQEGGEKTEVEKEPEFKEVKPEPEVKVEQEQKEVKTEPEVKVEQELKEVQPEPEVKVEQELKEAEAEPEVKVEQELKEVQPEPEVKVEQELKEAEAEPEVKVEQELKEVQPEPEVKVEQELKEAEAEPEVKVEQELKEVEAEPEVKVEQELKEAEAEPEVKVEQELKEVEAEPEVKVDLEANVEPEVETEPELEDDPDFKVESEVKVEPDVLEEPEPEVEPMFDEVQEQFQVQMNLEPETETGQEIEERHIDMEENYGMMDEPIMELEPLDDDNMFGDELSDTEKSLRASFLNQDPAVEPLPEEGGLMRQMDYAVDEEPIMELEPLDDDNMFGDELSDTEKSLRAAFLNQDPAMAPLPEEEGDYGLAEVPVMELEPEMDQEQFVPDAAIMEEGPALDNMDQQMQPVEEYFPNEVAQMGMEPMMMQEPVNEFVSEEELPPFEEPAVFDGGVQNGGLPK